MTTKTEETTRLTLQVIREDSEKTIVLPGKDVLTAGIAKNVHKVLRCGKEEQISVLDVEQTEEGLIVMAAYDVYFEEGKLKAKKAI